MFEHLKKSDLEEIGEFLRSWGALDIDSGVLCQTYMVMMLKEITHIRTGTKRLAIKGDAFSDLVFGDLTKE